MPHTGKTFVEKILAAKANRESVVPGEVVEVEQNDDGPPNGQHAAKKPMKVKYDTNEKGKKGAVRKDKGQVSVLKAGGSGNTEKSAPQGLIKTDLQLNKAVNVETGEIGKSSPEADVEVVKMTISHSECHLCF